MRLRESLGGVISGEHGIGITKLEFLDRRGARRRSRAYKQRVDPEGRFNRGKLLRPAADLANAYTPSLLADRRTSR